MVVNRIRSVELSDVKSLEIEDRIEVEYKGNVYEAIAIDIQNGEALFLFDECIDTAPMNETDTTRGGYEASEMRKFLQDAFHEMKFPDLIKSNLTPFENGDFLQLLSLQEVAGLDEKFHETKGQIPYFYNEKNRVSEYRGETCLWWLRSVVSAARFANVTYNGLATNVHHASAALGVRPAFKIRLS